MTTKVKITNDGLNTEYETVRVTAQSRQIGGSWKDSFVVVLNKNMSVEFLVYEHRRLIVEKV